MNRYQKDDYFSEEDDRELEKTPKRTITSSWSRTVTLETPSRTR